MSRLFCAAFALVAGCYADGAIGATTPVTGPATEGARGLFAGDIGGGAGIIWNSAGFDVGVSGQRIPAGPERNGVGPFGRLVFPLGGRDWLQGSIRFALAFAPEDDAGHDSAATSLKLSLGVLAMRVKPDAESAMGAGPALSIQTVDVAGVGRSWFVGLELSALFGGEILTWSDSDPDDV